MLMRRLRAYRLGVWLGVFAVAFYVWLPGHFAGHIAHAALGALSSLEGGHEEAAPSRHAHHPAGQDKHHGGTCPICAAAAASTAPAAAMVPAQAVLPVPASAALSVGLAKAHAPLTSASFTPYAPRGPPPAA